MDVKNGICRVCRRRDGSKPAGTADFFTAENHLDCGDIPEHLPELSQVEEMMIARVHVHVQVMCVRGQQYKYRGHVINFLRDIGKVYSQLPRLPEELDVIIVRPANTADNTYMQRQFRRDFRVRQAAIRIWLDFLNQNHPSYRDIVIDEQALSQLPADGNVMNRIITEESAAVDAQNEVDPDDDQSHDVEAAAVPNFFANQTDLEMLHNHMQNRGPAEQPPLQPFIQMPEVRSTPLSEFNRTQPLLSLAFPTLYPRGQADYIEPRQRTITYAEYIEHAMKWHDGRFARHPRFRFVVFNTLMRAQVNTRSSFFVKRSHGSRPVDIAELRAAFEENTVEGQALLNSVVRYTGSLRGTRAFWNGRRHQLDAMVHGLGTPNVFMTFSAADLHWDSLARHMPRYEEWKTATTEQQVSIARQNLRENPHIAAYHFHRRLTLFRTIVMQKKFNIKDYWVRYEWQGRGSSHSHGLYWLDGALPPQMRTAEDRQNFGHFWGLHVTAVNPEPQRVMDQGEGNPLTTVLFIDEQPTYSLLSRVVNRVQRHRCSPAYCLRKRKGAPADSELECRFYYPRAHHSLAHVTNTLNKKHWVFDGERNDSILNNYNHTLILGWLTNIDISPYTSIQAVLDYVGKYCSKGEKQTESYQDLATGILPKVSHRQPLISFVSRLMNKLVSERDWSAQEVCHLLLNVPLQEGTRVVRTVDCRHPDQQYHSHLIEDENIRDTRNVYERYLAHAEEWEDITYFEFLTVFDFGRREWRRFPEASARILNYFPRYKPATQLEDFSRVKLMLHHPHHDIKDLLLVKDTACETFEEAYQLCQQMHAGIHADDYYGAVPDAEDIDEFEEDPNHEDEIIEGDWEELARELPNRGPETEDIEVLGNRDIDLLKDWSDHVGKYPDLAVGDYWKMKKEFFAISFDVEDISDSAVDRLSSEQRLIYDLFITHLQDTQAGRETEQLLLNVDGRGGTGKSFVIRLISAHLQAIADTHNLGNIIVRAAPTGVAANGINGSTIYSLLRLPISRSSTLPPLTPDNLAAAQARLRTVRYLVIDEKSMLGLRQMHFIDQRLRQIFPAQSDRFVGGLNVLLMGDFYQLPPVMEKPLYFSKELKNPAELAGRNAYYAFNKTVELTQIHRQQGNEQAPFRLALEGLRNNQPTLEDWELLCSRVQSRQSLEEVASFDGAIRIYPTNQQVINYNLEHLVNLERPYIQVKATNQGPQADKVASSEAGNLHNRFPICLGARVMLTENVWTPVGLVNGANGTIYNFAWQAGANWREDPPHVILVQFDKYDGPPYFEDDDDDRRRRVVPIFRSTRDFIKGTANCSRTQFPLTVAYAITVHKSQGISVDKAVLNISERDFQPGLSYVAVSRVRTLDGVMFDSPFDLEAIRMHSSEGTEARARDAHRRAAERLQPPASE